MVVSIGTNAGAFTVTIDVHIIQLLVALMAQLQTEIQVTIQDKSTLTTHELLELQVNAG